MRRAETTVGGAGVGLALAALGGGLALRRRRRESAREHQARELARRAMRDEADVRRQVAETIHDGPVQELIALDMTLASARQATLRGDHERAAELLADARELTAQNVRMLRDELVELGPFPFEEEGSFEVWVERCLPIWERRHDMQLALSLERVDMPAETAIELFRITQEAVVNAGRHAQADTVSVSLRSVDGSVELRVVDDGKGIDGDPLADPEVGHLGLASIRERARLLGGRMELEGSERGTKLVVVVPLRD